MTPCGWGSLAGEGPQNILLALLLSVLLFFDLKTRKIH